MRNTFYAIVPECEHTGDLAYTVRGLRAIGCRVLHENAYAGEYETGYVTFATDDDFATIRAKAAKLVLMQTFDGEDVTLADECTLTTHEPESAY